ncbi:hypothetical protein K474DRAFT_1639618 [Panus rudis PR-1116 ss-1]|nr:hypothetical protein K474DRAFT_1639618 [Panus rudis PR-1116 ss-1]
MSKERLYHPLLNEENDEHLDDEVVQDPNGGRSQRRLIRLLSVALFFQTILMLSMSIGLWKAYGNKTVLNGQILYSPAQDFIEFHPVTFADGFAERTIYQGKPSDEVDKAWLDLYNDIGLSKIPKSQARLIPNKTLAIPGNEGYYNVNLAVFHQLHCLNLIRKGLSPDYYRDPVTGMIAGFAPHEWEEHVSHCVDSIRQSLMCASDISLIVWQWSEEKHQAVVKMNTVHSCRNYDRIVDWAKDHRQDIKFDLHVHVEDDIEIPTF